MSGKDRKRDNDPRFPRLLGERLCLDYVNSIEGRIGANPVDFLTEYSDLVHWGRHVGILDEAAAADLAEMATELPGKAESIFETAIVLRDVIYRIFYAIAHGSTPAQLDLDQLQQFYVEAVKHAQLVFYADGCQWQWFRNPPVLSIVLWPVVYSAIDLLRSDQLAWIKECPGADDCGWLFLDTSKNHSRRWCSMEGCGSRVKMRRQYARKRSAP